MLHSVFNSVTLIVKPVTLMVLVRHVNPMNIYCLDNVMHVGINVLNVKDLPIIVYYVQILTEIHLFKVVLNVAVLKDISTQV